MNEIAQRWSSRKFWAATVWQAVMVLLLVADHLPVEAFQSLTWLLLGGYFVGNVTQHVLLGRQ
ncbi:hypothetical protein PRZ61_12395 [Halomonas pacifica]|uniref:hypothetical protein n=1 Tax=Bisbaumannia pacifica TaxID=77098 RepID=UPI002358BD1B|nr:hypothetical protein [Halomonas pacifica]MDC8804241.1 hypothetical protein [Halomonas pacifica]